MNSSRVKKSLSISSSTSFMLTVSFWELLIIMYWERARAFALRSYTSSILSYFIIMFLRYNTVVPFMATFKDRNSLAEVWTHIRRQIFLDEWFEWIVEQTVGWWIREDTHCTLPWASYLALRHLLWFQLNACKIVEEDPLLCIEFSHLCQTYHFY